MGDWVHVDYIGVHIYIGVFKSVYQRQVEGI